MWAGPASVESVAGRRTRPLGLEKPDEVLRTAPTAPQTVAARTQIPERGRRKYCGSSSQELQSLNLLDGGVWLFRLRRASMHKRLRRTRGQGASLGARRDMDCAGAAAATNMELFSRRALRRRLDSRRCGREDSAMGIASIDRNSGGDSGSFPRAIAASLLGHYANRAQDRFTRRGFSARARTAKEPAEARTRMEQR